MSTNYVGDGTATESPSAAPDYGVAPTLNIPADGDALAASSVDQAHKASADFIDWLMKRSLVPVFGTGADGDVTVSTTVTLSGDMHYNNLTIASGGKLVTAGYRVFVKKKLTTQSGNLGITAAGAAGSGGTAGAAGATGTLLSGAAGGAGGTNGSVAGGNGGATTASLGGSGAAGGACSGGPGEGTAGTATQLAATLGTPAQWTPLGFAAGISGGAATLTAIKGGGGGGGGDTLAASTGGGGGAGGGILVVCAADMALNAAGDLTAAGGAGGNASGGNGGGGGGGGGGVAIFVYLSNGSATFSAATNCPGGAGGTKVGGGVNGAAGSNGHVYDFGIG